jgi:trigger factor
VTDEAVDQTLQQLRERAAKFEPVEGRAIADGDTAVLDIDRKDADRESDRHENVSIEIGGPSNPPGFDANLVGLSSGDDKTFTIHFPADYAVKEMADTDVTYSVKVKDVRRKVLPELDDEFAKDLGAFDSLATLRDKVRADLEEEARDSATRQVRSAILKQLSDRVTFDLPSSLVEREIDRRLEEFARQLMQQNVDPRQAGIDWGQFREAQRDPARAAVASALALDEIAKRENITVAAEDVDKEIERFAVRAGRTPAALRAQLEKEGGVARLHAGLRREKAVDLALTRATITDE